MVKPKNKNVVFFTVVLRIDREIHQYSDIPYFIEVLKHARIQSFAVEVLLVHSSTEFILSTSYLNSIAQTKDCRSTNQSND